MGGSQKPLILVSFTELGQIGKKIDRYGRFNNLLFFIVLKNYRLFSTSDLPVCISVSVISCQTSIIRIPFGNIHSMLQHLAFDFKKSKTKNPTSFFLLKLSIIIGKLDTNALPMLNQKTAFCRPIVRIYVLTYLLSNTIDLCFVLFPSLFRMLLLPCLFRTAGCADCSVVIFDDLRP